MWTCYDTLHNVLYNNELLHSNTFHFSEKLRDYII